MSYDYSSIVEDLLAWYDKSARVLPWRSNPRPYYVWVSEIMLQQTRVEAVKDYFRRFLAELPEIKDLAAAKEDKLLKLWEGLGYYNRVRNLQKAAIAVTSQYGGELPADYEELLKLPGIGSYTAGAIASIAYRIPVPAVDGNVLRVAKRISAGYEDITRASVKKELEQDLLAIMPEERPGDFNQALMELGAMVCIPNGRPLCTECPVTAYCQGYKKGVMMELPVKPPKKKRKIEERTVLVLEYQNKYALHKRPEKGLLARLWELPNMEGRLSVPKLEDFLDRQGAGRYELQLLGDAVHVFSHVEWHMLGYKIQLLDKNPWDEKEQAEGREPYGQEEEEDSFVWVDKEQMDRDYALPSAFSAYQKSIMN